MLTYIRSHWIQENGLHWVKDAILNEDSARDKQRKTSRLIGFLKDIVVSIGFNLFQSVRKFIDHFRGNPLKVFELIMNSK